MSEETKATEERIHRRNGATEIRQSTSLSRLSACRWAAGRRPARA